MSIEETIELAVASQIAPLRQQLAEIHAAILHKPDETVLSDDEAAKLKNVSVSTLRRMKSDGRIKSIRTPKGRMVRVCDL